MFGTSTRTFRRPTGRFPILSTWLPLSPGEKNTLKISNPAKVPNAPPDFGGFCPNPWSQDQVLGKGEFGSIKPLNELKAQGALAPRLFVRLHSIQSRALAYQCPKQLRKLADPPSLVHRSFQRGTFGFHAIWDCHLNPDLMQEVLKTR